MSDLEVIREAMGKAKDINYGILTMGKRTFVIVQRYVNGTYNHQSIRDQQDNYDPKAVLPDVRFRILTYSLDAETARRLYTKLVLNQPISEADKSEYFLKDAG